MATPASAAGMKARPAPPGRLQVFALDFPVEDFDLLTPILRPLSRRE